MTTIAAASDRRHDDSNVKEYLGGPKRVFDPRQGIDVVKIISGDWHVTRDNVMLATILGSCVSACIRDPITKIGGMNHFLLPGEDSSNQNSDSARYGVFAMESLINGILKEGGRKERLEVKVFGGGNVINNSARIGSKNAEFIRTFLQKEGFSISSEDLEGDYPRRIHYYPVSGKLMMRQLKRREDLQVIETENRYKQEIIHKPVEGNIELF
jgi:chemotaxis protein CheD